MASDKIKVAVRVRPFNRRELELGTQCVVEMDKLQTVLHQPTTIDKLERKVPKTFAFDHCFNSIDPLSTDHASQEHVFDCLGTDILDNAFQGYNACIFAYGQTGSGKSYTMMGGQESKGVIPRLCDSLFDRIAKCQSSEQSYKVEVSYMEIYNEKVHDLLDPKPNKQSLKVREHAVLGPYVDGLSLLAVSSFQDIDNLMAEGNKSRTVAATNMNCESSRSHAVFSVVLTQTLVDTGSGVSGERVSRMSLVDLAGSERAAKTGAVGERLKEGSNINKSLTTLGLVISKLADQSTNTRNKQDKFVPYRDSVLTWLLKDNLGGNSKTVMVATISPAADNYEETLSTLRYADRAKRIVNHAVVNEDPNARIIRELRQEVEALKEMLKHATASNTPPLDIHEKLTESEKLMKEMSTTWEEKLIKTEQLQQERQEALENMGISVQASGIKVEKNKFYLVNLNADPSLNELLVYYLKERTLVGVRGASINQDIQLSGLGIQPEHCILTIEDEQKLYMIPLANARSFINGSSVTVKTLLHNGDRILWGNHHFFRVNCPKLATAGTLTSSEPQTPAQTIDYNFAREEFMLNELSNDPLQAAIAEIEKQHEEDKQVALEKQRKEYERQFQQLRNILSPSTPYSPYYPFDTFRTGKITPCTPTTQMRVEKWAKERDDMFKRSLVKLKIDIVRANELVKEANILAEEMNKKTKFSVTLQIPPANLSPNRKKGRFVSEPAILVKRQGVGSQVWSMEKLENKIVDMREMFEERKENSHWITAEENPAKAFDPFYETQENHNLIGVANVFLEVLCHDVTLDYQTPIISQQGDVAGRLQVEICRISGTLPQDRICETASESSSDSSRDENDGGPSQVTIKVTIKQASGLPPSLSNFVFCQYTFWTHPESIAVPPKMNPDPTLLQKRTGTNDSMTFTFDHTKEFTFAVTEEFIEHCAEGALSIEVWGHRSAGFTRTKPGWEVEQHQLAKARSLADRWSELTRKIELWVEIQELNEAGDYSGVEVTSRQDVLTGGVYQLRQGQQRRVKVRVAPVQQSGTLPIICEEITNIAVGSASARSKLQKPLDSYQEEDLSLLRDKWSEALMRRRNYLDHQIQRIINKQGKSERDVEREQSLVEQWVSLTEERNAVMVPASGSGIPGAPADWHPPPGMEPHIPVLFLDLNADDLSTSKWNSSENSAESIPVAGHNSILPKELGNLFFNLPIIKHCVKDVCAVAAWDSSVHDSPYLNRVTDSNERVYLILKTTVRLSHPAPMDLVLRKRLCLNIYKRQSITDRIRRRIVRSDWLTNTGVTYEVVSNIPKASEELEERESLAQIAASEEAELTEGESYIETYTKGVSAVEGILTLERLRQKVAVKEILQHKGHTLTMRKTASVPNFSHLMMFDNSLESLTLGGVSRSESVSDLNKEVRDQVKTPRKSLPDTDSLQAPAKQYGIARPTFLNLNLNLNTLRLQPGSKPSPNTKLGLRMTTLHEEQTNVLPHHEDGDDLIEEEDEDEDEENSKNNENNCTTTTNNATSHTMQFSEYEPFQMEADRIKRQTKVLPSSRTLDSLVELQSTKGGTPSTSSSSGYGSQAVSSSNLTNDDCLSLRSISVDETPDVEHRSSIGELATSTTNVQHSTELPARARQSVTANQQAPLHPSTTEGNVVSSTSSCATVSSTATTSLYQSSSVVNTMANTTNTVTSSSTMLQSVTSHSITQLTKTNAVSTTVTSNNVGNNGNNNSNSNTATSAKSDGQHSGTENHKSSSDDVSTSNSGENVNTGLPPGKVVRRRKSASRTNMHCRASFPQAKPQVSESKAAMRLEQKLSSDFAINGDSHSSDNHTEDETEHIIKETPIPEWVCLGESVQIRPYNSTGVIAYIGPTEFASGTWVGVDLDAPYGKNDGTVQGVRYFDARPKHGIFVRADKLIQDRRGRAMRGHETNMRRSSSRGEGLSSLQRSRSRGEGLSTVGKSAGRLPK